jgi:hypothetical protein
MDGFNYDQIEGLKNILGVDNDVDDEPRFQLGSALNPATIAGRENKEIAKPGVKMEVKVYDRGAAGGAANAPEPVKEEAKPTKKQNPK